MRNFFLLVFLVVICGISDAWAATLYRSVGTNSANLNTSSFTVTISGTTATFSEAMPDNIGVGDALVYGSTYIAFISARSSSTVYTVQDATGGAPTAAGQGTSVSVYRCFLSLSAWNANTTANTNIAAAVRSSVLISNMDLVSAGNVMMVPCYADGVDSGGRVTVSAWTTGTNNYIKIYTPVGVSEVGTTQRHGGKWGGGYRRTQALTLSVNYARLDGLSIYQTSDDRIYFVSDSTGAGEIQISNCFGWYASATNGVYDVFDIWTVGALTVKLWNCIGISDSTSTSSEAFYFNDSDVTFYCYNCTGIANGGRGFRNGASTSITLKNCLGYSATGSAFNNFSAGTITYSAADDTTAGAGTGCRNEQTFSFVDTVNKDYHLLPTDAGASNYGTNLSGDEVISFNTDIDGNARPVGAAWDIGADETMPISNGLIMGMEF